MKTQILNAATKVAHREYLKLSTPDQSSQRISM